MRRILSLFALSCALAVPAALHADTFTYTFTDGATPPANGTATSFSFSYTGTGLLTLSSIAVPTDTCSATYLNTPRACDVVTLAGFSPDDDRIKMLKIGGGEYYDQLSVDFFATLGVHTDAGGNTLTITDVPDTSSVPEPGSFALLGTGLLGLAGAIRRRLIR